MMDATEVKAEIRDFLKLTQISDATFGRYGMNDSSFVSRLSDRESLQDETVIKVRKYMLGILQGSKDKEKAKLAKRIEQSLEQLLNEYTPKPKPVRPAKPKVEQKIEPKVEPVAPQDTPAVETQPKAPVTSITARKARIRPVEALSGRPASLGSRFQEIALEDSISDAVRVVQSAWPETWRKICQAARDRKVRPVTLMIEILEGATP